MNLQQIGTISFDGVKPTSYDAMICVDRDLPGEIVLHLSRESQAPRVLHLDVTNFVDRTIICVPQFMYDITDSGEIRIPPPARRVLPDDLADTTIFAERYSDRIEGFIRPSAGADRKFRFVSSPEGPLLDAYQCADWEDFKKWARREVYEGGAIQFRGHGSRDFILQTTFHRSGLSRIDRYCWGVLREFVSHAESFFNTRIDMSDPDNYAIYLGLAQHHGLPTPMLDWTASPYIAAFFAFADAIESQQWRPNVSHVRVYAITRDLISAFDSPSVVFPYHRAYIAPLSVSGRSNPRLYAQQGRFLVSNISNIEAYILKMQDLSGVPFIKAADVPLRFAVEALSDLRFMGVTAASLLPGLDGICRMMKHDLLIRSKSASTIASNLDVAGDSI